MCRSHRRCPSSSNRHRTRALNTANKAVERARNALRAAQGSGEADAIAAAEQRLTDAQTNRDAVAAAHPLPHDKGHDMTGNDHTDQSGDDRQADDQQPGTAAPDSVTSLREAYREADRNWLRANDAVDAARRSGDPAKFHAAEDAAYQARLAEVSARRAWRAAERTSARQMAAEVSGHSSTVTGRGNVTVTGHTGPLNITRPTAPHSGGHDTNPHNNTSQPTTAPQTSEQSTHSGDAGSGNITVTGNTVHIDGTTRPLTTDPTQPAHLDATGTLHIRPGHGVRADTINGDVTIGPTGARVRQHTAEQQAEHDARQAEHQERVRAHIDAVHRQVTDAQRRAREAAAEGDGDHSVVNGDGQITVNGVTGGSVHVGRVNGEVWVNGRRVQ